MQWLPFLPCWISITLKWPGKHCDLIRTVIVNANMWKILFKPKPTGDNLTKNTSWIKIIFWKPSHRLQRALFPHILRCIDTWMWNSLLFSSPVTRPCCSCCNLRGDRGDKLNYSTDNHYLLNLLHSSIFFWFPCSEEHAQRSDRDSGPGSKYLSWDNWMQLWNGLIQSKVKKNGCSTFNII